MKKLVGICMLFAILLVFFNVNSEYKPVENTINPSEQQSETIVKPQKDSENKKVVVLMYHSIVDDNSKKDKYVITPYDFEQDIKYLINKGYKILSCEQLLESTNNNSLTSKTAVITFDDGFYSNVKYAMPILNKYGVKGTFAVVGAYADNRQLTDNNGIFAYMKWSDVKQLSSSMEIASHSYNMHNLKGRKGVSKLKSESEMQYKQVFTADCQKNHEKLTEFSKAPITFAYPFGIYNTYSEQVLKTLGYKITLTCNEGLNYVKSAEDLRLLKRFNRDGKMTSKDFMLLNNI